MAKSSNPNLQPNPFVTYRDPQTGLWVVVHSAAIAESSTSNHSQEPQEVQSTQNQKA